MLYGAKCWTVSRAGEKMVDVFERKILRRKHGPSEVRYQWRCRFNRKLYDLFK
jgi:hypothetical protein